MINDIESDANNRPSFVLSGGGALGAYEVGVLNYIVTRIFPTLPEKRLGHVAGTSIGAINAAYMTAYAHDLNAGVEKMASTWRELSVQSIIPIYPRNLIGLLLKPPTSRRNNQNGIADASKFVDLIVHSIPWLQKRRNFKRGRYLSMSIPATRISDGLSEIFYESNTQIPLDWANDQYTVTNRTILGPAHILASSAFPFLFPPGYVEQQAYTDGGIRYNTPLSPALRLGAKRIIAVCLSNQGLTHKANPERIKSYNSPVYLGGKVLQVLLIDQAEKELATADMFNKLLAHGSFLYGEAFVQQFNEVTRSVRGAPIHPARILTLRPSENINAIARETARTLLRKRKLTWLQGRLIRWLVDDEDNELLSIMLFDGLFTGELIRLGMADARARHDEIVDTFTGPLLVR